MSCKQKVPDSSLPDLVLLVRFISFIDLLPEAINSVGFGVANVAFFVGMGLFAIVVYFVPEPDMAVVAVGKKFDDEREKKYLMHVGVLTALGISLHK